MEQVDQTNGVGDDRSQIRAARGKFVAMAASYSLGSLNDNFFKQAFLLMAVALSIEAHRQGDVPRAKFFADLQGNATVLYTLPFILLACVAGWLSDRFSKRNIVLAAKTLELVAMCVGAAGICLGHWNLILTMIFVMGVQATLFSPAINGSIPELYPAHYVTQANALMKVATTSAILIGVAGASFAIGIHRLGPGGVPLGQWVVGVLAVALAALGLAVSLGVPRRPAANPQARFPWWGPVDTLRELWNLRRDGLLAATVAVDSYVWFLGSLLVLLVNTLGMKQLGYSEGKTGGLIFAELIGVALGGLLAGKIARGERWYAHLGPSGVGMGVCLATIAGLVYLPPDARYATLLAALVGAGIFGGLMLVPLESFIQVRPAAERKGTVIASANFAAFVGILLSGPQANAFYASQAPVSLCLALMGVLTAILGVVLWVTLTRRGRA